MPLSLRKGEGPEVSDYRGMLQQARRAARRGDWKRAMEDVREAIRLDGTRPEAFNILGAFHEIAGDMAEAERAYRTALDLDGAYEPAQHNLERLTARARDDGNIWMS